VRPARSSVAAALVFAAILGGCGRDDEPVTRPSDAFCDAAVRFEDRLERGASLDEQIRLVRRLVQTAPVEIEADARTFLDALESLRNDPDDPGVRDDPDVKEAVDDVNRFATNGCDLFERDGGGSPL
jgi:hypothetical protein